MSNVDWVRTRNEICEMALRKVGAMSDNETLTGKKLDNAVQNLNMLTKRLQNHNIMLWNLVQQTVISTVAGTQSYAITNDNIVGVHRAWLRTGAGTAATDTPIDVVSYDIIAFEPQLKATQGQPSQIALNFDFTTPRLYLYPTPDAVYNLYVVAMVKMKDWDNASDSTLFPPWWIETLVWMLADALAPDYGCDGALQQSLKARAMEALGQARVDNFNRSDTFFEPY